MNSHPTPLAALTPQCVPNDTDLRIRALFFATVALAMYVTLMLLITANYYQSLAHRHLMLLNEMMVLAQEENGESVWNEAHVRGK